jgi:hypothetical protein
MVSGRSVIDGDLRTVDVLTIALWAWTGVSMSLNGPSARRSCLIVRDILEVKIDGLGRFGRRQIVFAPRSAIPARKISMPEVNGQPLKHLP